MTIQSAEALQESIRGGMIESGEYEKYANHADNDSKGIDQLTPECFRL
jgi:hypothetical protein